MVKDAPPLSPTRAQARVAAAAKAIYLDPPDPQEGGAAVEGIGEVSRVAANKAGDNHFPALAQQPRRGLCLFLEIAQQRAISKEINLTCSQLH